MLNNFFQNILPHAISGISPLSLILVYLGGILTSVSPCVLTMIPVMIGYIGGYTGGEESSKIKGFGLSAICVLGMSVTFSIFGIVAVMLGKVFGQIGNAWYYVLAAVAIIMGLQLLGVINLQFPTLSKLPVKKGGIVSTFLIGMLFGLVMSPCATPVLAVIIAYVASTGNLIYGAVLLFVYGLGHGLPLIVVGTFTASIKQLPKFQKYTHYITVISGVVLILLGLYFLILVRWR